MNIHALICSAFFIFAGIMHFVKPRFFLKIMPPFVPFHKEVVAISGVFEMVLGVLLLFENTRFWASIGLIILLIVVFPANIYMAFDLKFAKISPWIRYGRLPLQFVAIWWMYSYILNT
jgi:uncharacterized membrane protein